MDALSEPVERPTSTRARGPGARVLVAVAVAGLVLLLLIPTSGPALALVEWIRGAGAAGVAVYAVAYLAATIFMVPGSLLTLGAGFAYGPVLGTLLVSPVSVAAAWLAFVLGRSLARGLVERRTAGHPRLAAIDAAVRIDGFRVVLLLRLSPVVPFNLLNYALGVSAVRARDYVVASFLGMLPGTVLYVYLGSLVTSASELLRGGRPMASGWGAALYWGGLAATVLATVLLTRAARRALRRTLGEPGVEPGGEGRS